MTSYDKLSLAEAGRARAREIGRRLSRAGEAPQLQGVLPNVTGDDPNKLELLRQGQDNDVTIIELIDVIAPPGRTVVVQLVWNGLPAGAPLPLTTPVPAGPHTLVLPGTATVAAGVYNLYYTVTYAGNPKSSDSIDIYIDQTAPNQGNRGGDLVLPAGLPNGVITNEYLAANNDTVVLTIPQHPDRKTGDHCTVLLGTSIPGTIIGTYTVPDNPGPDMTVELKRAHLVSSGEGARILYYRWKDRVGNEGPNSESLDITVQLTPAPSALLPPEVPEAVSPDIIDLADAWPSVTVAIPAYSDGRAGDEVVVVWDGIIQTAQPVDTNFEAKVEVPYADVLANGTGPRDVVVTYSILRGGTSYPEGTDVTVGVDLSTTGPVNPGPDPTTPNPALTALTVKGSASPDNTLRAADSGNPVTITAPIYTPNAAGETVRLYWNGAAVGDADGGLYTVAAGDTEITFTVPWTVVEASGNHVALPVQYKIQNVNGNENPSLIQDVDVYILPVNLNDPVILHLYSDGGPLDYINCSSLREIPTGGRGAIVSVPGGTPLEQGHVLTFAWTGERQTDPNPGPVPDFTFDKTLSGNEHIDGFNVYLPFDAALEPILDGLGSIVYTVEIAGRPETSGAHEVIVVVRNGEGDLCPIS